MARIQNIENVFSDIQRYFTGCKSRIFHRIPAIIIIDKIPSLNSRRWVFLSVSSTLLLNEDIRCSFLWCKSTGIVLRWFLLPGPFVIIAIGNMSQASMMVSSIYYLPNVVRYATGVSIPFRRTMKINHCHVHSESTSISLYHTFLPISWSLQWNFVPWKTDMISFLWAGLIHKII